jgi:hypothetical protein
MKAERFACVLRQAGGWPWGAAVCSPAGPVTGHGQEGQDSHATGTAAAAAASLLVARLSCVTALWSGLRAGNGVSHRFR